MTQKTHDDLFDFIIVGAGPAGLSIGAELSKKCRGLIIEKNKAGSTERFWFVPPNVIDEDVKPYTYGGVTRYLTRTFSGSAIQWKAKQFDRYPYINEHTLLPHWIDVIKQNHSLLIDDCAYQDMDVNNGVVSVRTTKGSFKARLLIDASGYDSPIIRKYGITRRNLYWWSVYGAVGKHPRGLGGDLQVGDYMLWQTFRDTNTDPGASLNNERPVFEYEILGNDKSFSLILYLCKERVTKDVMKEEFTRIIRTEDSTRDFRDLEILEEKYGWYPSGDISQQQIAEDRVLFVGDAGCWTTPCGWGMGFILDNYKFFSGRIAGAIEQDRLDKESLLALPHFGIRDKYEILLNALATHFLANASAPQLDRFINLFGGEIDPLLCEKLFSLTITEEEVVGVLRVLLSHFDLKELVHIVPRQDYLLILELAKYFLEDSVLQEFQELAHLLGEKPGPSSAQDGFNFQ